MATKKTPKEIMDNYSEGFEFEKIKFSAERHSKQTKFKLGKFLLSIAVKKSKTLNN